MIASSSPQDQGFSLAWWQEWQKSGEEQSPSSSCSFFLLLLSSKFGFLAVKVRTLEIPQLLAYIGSRILSQNPQNGAVRTRAHKLGFQNPLGRISDPLERLFNLQNLVLSGSPRSDAEVSTRTKSARADVPNRSDGFFSFSGFICFDALDLILALVFPLW